VFIFFVVRLGCGNLYDSLEQVQVELFGQQICRGLKLSIFQYSMVLFRHRKNEGIHLTALG
jgi:hypothetical protein